MSNRQGFTVVEVLVAVMVLGVGILGLVGSSALVTRMIGQGKLATNAAQIGQRRLENFRRIASSTPIACANLTAQTGTSTSARITEEWTITVAPGTRTIAVRVIYPEARGIDTVSLTTIVGCY